MPLMIKHYTGLFNKALDTRVPPESWSLGLFIPLYRKKGDMKHWNNHRGITLLSCIAKLFTSILNERLKLFCDDHDIINENQAGFRADYSTIDHVFFS